MVGVQQQGGGTAWHWQWGDTLYAGAGDELYKLQPGVWSCVPSPPFDQVGALRGFDGALYAGGDGGEGIARWKGTDWPTLACGFDALGQVLARHVHDDELGAQPASYVGGHLHMAFDPQTSTDSDYTARWGCGGIVQWGETGGD
jgi:hypothetical protein